MTKDIEETKAAQAREIANYNAIAVPLQNAFEEVAKLVTDPASAVVLMACASIVYHEAIVIAANNETGNKFQRLNAATRFLAITIKQIDRDIVNSITDDIPVPSHATPRTSYL